MDGRRGTSNRWGDLDDRYSIADHPEHCLVPLLHDAQLQQHARECHDQAEPASRIGRSRVSPHPEPKCHASGGTKHVCASPTSRAPRFLPGACRHGWAPFRAFVWVEGGPSTPGRGERPASGSPTVFAEASQTSPVAGEGFVATGKGTGRGWDRAASGTARGVPHPGTSEQGALGDAGRSPDGQDASGEGHQAQKRLVRGEAESEAGTTVHASEAEIAGDR
jgi:hypothetical protein